MGYIPQTKEEISQNVAEELDWQFAERNDEAVAQALQAGEAIEAIYTVNEAELLSGFFGFLRNSGIIAHWRTFTIEGVQRVFQPAIYFVLLYSTRVLFGIGSSEALIFVSAICSRSGSHARRAVAWEPPLLSVIN